MPGGHDAERWKDRRVLAAALGLSIAVFPVGCSVGAAIGVSQVVHEPDSIVGFGAWWLGMLAVCTLVFLGTERIAPARCSPSPCC